jgi:transposase-like protein
MLIVVGGWMRHILRLKVSGVICKSALINMALGIDFCLRAKRDAVAAKTFFRKAIRQHGKPIKINVDKSGANKCALDAINDNYSEDQKIEIRQNKYLNNMIEQDHRFIKRRTKPALGYKSFNSSKTNNHRNRNHSYDQKRTTKNFKSK